MANLTLRQVKGSPLTISEMDGNFEYFTGSYTNTGTITAQGFIGTFTGSFSGSISGVITSASYAINAGTAQNATSASYALDATNATNATNAATASYITTAQTASYILATDIDGSTLGNYIDDAAAAVGGVPLYGLYRNGNIVLIRIV